MQNASPRSDTFYRLAVGAGVLLALFAVGWGRWNLGQSRERLFAVDEQQILARTAAAEQLLEVERIDAYGASIRRSLAAEKDRNSHHYFFLSDEADRTDKRLQHARIEMERRRGLADLKTRQAAFLQRQMQIDASRSDGLAVLGLTLTVAGFFLWYLRRQRHLDAALRIRRPHPEPPKDDFFPWDEVAVWTDANHAPAASPTGGRESESPFTPR